MFKENEMLMYNEQHLMYEVSLRNVCWGVNINEVSGTFLATSFRTGSMYFQYTQYRTLVFQHLPHRYNSFLNLPLYSHQQATGCSCRL